MRKLNPYTLLLLFLTVGTTARNNSSTNNNYITTVEIQEQTHTKTQLWNTLPEYLTIEDMIEESKNYFDGEGQIIELFDVAGVPSPANKYWSADEVNEDILGNADGKKHVYKAKAVARLDLNRWKLIHIKHNNNTVWFNTIIVWDKINSKVVDNSFNFSESSDYGYSTSEYTGSMLSIDLEKTDYEYDYNGGVDKVTNKYAISFDYDNGKFIQKKL